MKAFKLTYNNLEKPDRFFETHNDAFQAGVESGGQWGVIPYKEEFDSLVTKYSGGKLTWDQLKEAITDLNEEYEGD